MKESCPQEGFEEGPELQRPSLSKAIAPAATEPNWQRGPLGLNKAYPSLTSWPIELY
jgi:hypothetical protein